MAKPNSHSARRILCLAGASPLPETLAAALGSVAELRVVETPAEFAAELASGRYDLVLTDAAVPHLAGKPDAFPAGRVLENIGRGVCVFGPDGDLLWSNALLTAYEERIRDELASAARQIISELTSGATTGMAPVTRDISIGRERQFELTVTPLVRQGGALEAAVVLVSDVTVKRQLQHKLDAIDSAGRELVRLDADASARLEVGERLQLLEDRILRRSRELLNFEHLVIRVLDRKTNRLETVVAGGLSEEAKSLEIYADAENNGITGYVAATGRAYLCRDASADSRYLPGLEHAGSTLTVPLWLNDQVVGTLNVESPNVGAFTEADLQFAEIFGRYIAIALHMLQLLVVERHTATDQVAADVGAEVSGPMDEIAAAVAKLAAATTASPELRRETEAILAAVERVKDVLASVTEHSGVEGLLPTTLPPDPMLSGKRILVADDEDIIRETVAEVLTRAGARPVLASDGNEAVAIIGSQRLDLVLSDIKMPNRNGYEVFAAVQNTDLPCPVILMTGFGYDPNHSIVRASREGLAGVLFKPFKVEQLLEDVRNALAEHEAGGHA